MRHRRWLAAIAFLGSACGGDDDGDVGPADAGEVDAAAQSCLEREEIELDFALEGLADFEYELDLTCVALERDPAGADSIVDFTECTDGSGTAHADLALTLIGDWPAHSLGNETPTRLRYIQLATGSRIDRWLFTETDGQFPVPLVVVDAETLSPSEDSLTVGPVALSLEAGDCELFRFPDGCGPFERFAVRGEYEGAERTVLDGTTAALTGGPPDFLSSVQYQLIVPYAAVMYESFCTRLPIRNVVMALVAFPFS